MRQADREGLLDEANLTIWLTWYQLGGTEAPPTISEIAQWPAALRNDVLYLTRQLGDIRRSKKSAGKGKQKNHEK